MCWGWLFEGDRVDLYATATVVDVAVELLRYHCAHHDGDAARHVVETLTTIDPVKAHETMTGTTP